MFIPVGIIIVMILCLLITINNKNSDAANNMKTSDILKHLFYKKEWKREN